MKVCDGCKKDIDEDKTAFIENESKTKVWCSIGCYKKYGYKLKSQQN